MLQYYSIWYAYCMQYHFPEITLSIVALYLLSTIIVKTNRLTLVVHKQIWNSALATFFTATAILGILLVLRSQYDIFLNMPFNMLFWHVESGIGFSLVALFHLLWHSSYFQGILAKLFPKNKPVSQSAPSPVTSPPAPDRRPDSL